MTQKTPNEHQTSTHPEHDCQEKIHWHWHIQKPYVWASCGICNRMVSLEQAPELDAKDAAQAERERELHNAYMRIRELVGAWDTNKGGENRFEVTENKIKALKDRVRELEELLNHHRDCTLKALDKKDERIRQLEEFIRSECYCEKEKPEHYGECGFCDFLKRLAPVAPAPPESVMGKYAHVKTSADEFAASKDAAPAETAKEPDRCCDNGFFGDSHECQKQKPEPEKEGREVEKVAAEIVVRCFPVSNATSRRVYLEVVEALQASATRAKEKAAEECAKALEENGWNDTIPTQVNMKEVAFRYARFLRGLKWK